MQFKEQVKHGTMTPQSVMDIVSKDSHTYGWCKRRAQKGTPVVPTEATPAKSKYKRKKK